jgi:transcriptional regulator with XRE-family HTH domain
MGRKLTARQIARIRRLRYEDGLSSGQVAAIIGCSPSTVLNHAPGRPGKVPVAPLREAFLRSGVTAASVAFTLGWMERGKRDGARVKRTLGILDDINHGHPSRRTMVDAEIVMLIADAIGVGAWEVLPDIEDERRAA